MKMSTLTALCFPETIPTFRSAAPLLLLLDSVVHYRPTECKKSSDSPALFAGTDLLDEYAPAPLGNDLDLFLRMVKDLRTNAGEYANNFISTLGASIVDKYQKESVQQIISALSKHGKTLSDDTTDRDEGFWRTRLLLQLAEEMRIEENEIAARLSMAADKQQQMLRLLREGDDENEATAMLDTPIPSPRLPFRDDLLCRAWCRLFLADGNESRPLILATANTEAADLLMDTYSQHYNNAASTVYDLTLPSFEELNEHDYLAKRKAFRDSASALIAGIKDDIIKKLTDGDAGPATKGEEAAAQWQAELTTHFGNSTSHASRLRVTMLPGASPADLCRRLGKSDYPATGPEPAHTMLIHLAPCF